LCDAQLLLCDGNFRARRHGMCEPHISAYDRTFTHYGLSAQDGRTGIYDYVVFYRGMALRAAYKLARFVLREGERSERHALIEFNVIADHGGFAYNDSRAVIDEEAAAYCGIRVNVDARQAVGMLGHYARNERHCRFGEKMSGTVDHNRIDAGIREDYFAVTSGGGVSVISRLHV